MKCSEGSIFVAWALYLILGTHYDVNIDSCVLKAFINTMCKYCYTRVILHNVREVYSLEHGRHMNVAAHVRELVLSKNVLL